MSAVMWNQTLPPDEKTRLDSVLLPFQQATKYVAQNHSRLLGLYPEQWIAVSGHSVVASGPDRDTVRAILRENKHDRNRVYITFLTTKIRTLIL